MQKELQAISYIAAHDPAVIAGLLLIGCSSVLFVHSELRMVRAGYRTSLDVLRGPLDAKGWRTPGHNLKVRASHGWSAWPVYLAFPLTVAGVVLLLFGLLRL